MSEWVSERVFLSLSAGWLAGFPDDTVTTVHTLGIQVQPKLPTLQVVGTSKNGLAVSGPVYTTIQQSGLVTFSFTIRNTGVAPTAPLEPFAPEFDSSLGFSVMFLTNSYPALAPGSSTVVQVGSAGMSYFTPVPESYEYVGLYAL